MSKGCGRLVNGEKAETVIGIEYVVNTLPGRPELDAVIPTRSAEAA